MLASSLSNAESGEEPAAAPIPLLLITGFLGSGKTTFINRLLGLAGPPKLGVVVNEFGQIGIDGTLMAGTEIMELANGCVCCAKGTELWESALELVDRAGAQVLIVETSGLVEPAVLLEQYALLPKALGERLELRGLVCLVDALHLKEALGRRHEVEQQIRLADRLLLTKSDVCPPEDLLAAHRILDELGASTERAGITPLTPGGEVKNLLRWALRPVKKGSARRRSASRSRRPVGAGEAYSQDARAEQDAHAEQNVHAEQNAHAEQNVHADVSDHTDHIGHDTPAAHGSCHAGRQLVAVSVQEPLPLLAAPLQQLLRELPGEVLRVKGFVRLFELSPDGQPEVKLWVLQLAGRRVELVPANTAIIQAAPAGSTLVFIGEELDESWLRLRLSACRSG